MPDLAIQLPDDLQRSLALALRAGELASLPAASMRCGAYRALAEALADRAQSLSIAAQFADRLVYQRRDEQDAARLAQLAQKFQSLAEGAD